MKKRIKGKTYNTETAKYITMMDDTEYKVLYKTKTGDYFIISVDDSGENITPYSEVDGWIMEESTDNTPDDHMTYEEWKTHKLALEKVKEFVQNNLDHPFNSNLQVVMIDNKLVFRDGKITITISFDDDVTFSWGLSKEEYEHTYDIWKNREKITSMYYYEMGYDEEDGTLIQIYSK